MEDSSAGSVSQTQSVKTFRTEPLMRDRPRFETTASEEGPPLFSDYGCPAVAETKKITDIITDVQ